MLKLRTKIRGTAPMVVPKPLPKPFDDADFLSP
jgi:hypothetical protein